MHTPEPVLALLRMLLRRPLAHEEARRRFGGQDGAFEAALRAAGNKVTQSVERRGQEHITYLAVSPEGRQALQAG